MSQSPHHRTGGEPDNSAAGHRIVVVGASSGGVQALMSLVAGLPATLPASVLIVLHLSPDVPSHLPEILRRAGRLPVSHATEHGPLERSHIYVAPPDHQLLVEPGYLHLVRGPRENRHRPAIDPLFRSAALAYGPQVIGVVLSGALDDGTAGLLAIKERGGLAVVQDPRDALVPSMPENALEYVSVDHVLSVREMPALLTQLVGTPAATPTLAEASPTLSYEHRATTLEADRLNHHPPMGALVPLTCPECGGPLWEYRDKGLVRFRCRVGHAFSGETMAAAQSAELDRALWAAYNGLRESALLSERLANEARQRGHGHVAQRFDERHQQYVRHSESVLRVLAEGQAILPDVARTTVPESTEIATKTVPVADEEPSVLDAQVRAEPPREHGGIGSA